MEPGEKMGRGLPTEEPGGVVWGRKEVSSNVTQGKMRQKATLKLYRGSCVEWWGHSRAGEGRSPAAP